PAPELGSYLTRGDRRGQARHTQRLQKRRSCDLVVPVSRLCSLHPQAAAPNLATGRKWRLIVRPIGSSARLRSPKRARAGSGERPYATDQATRANAPRASAGPVLGRAAAGRRARRRRHTIALLDIEAWHGNAGLFRQEPVPQPALRPRFAALCTA